MLKKTITIIFILFSLTAFSQNQKFERFFAVSFDYNIVSSLGLGIAVGKYDYPGAWAGERHQLLFSLKEIRYDYQLCQNLLLFGYDLNYGFENKTKTFGIRPKLGLGVGLGGLYLGYNFLVYNNQVNYNGFTIGGGFTYPFFQKETKNNKGLFGLIRLKYM